MSATHPDSRLDSSQLAPALAAIVIVVVTAAIALFFTGLPH
jgi:hypothetical protein